MKNIAIIHFKRPVEKVVKVMGNQIRRDGNRVTYINPSVIWEEDEEETKPSYSKSQALSQFDAFIIVANEDTCNFCYDDLYWLSSLIIANRDAKKFAIFTFTKNLKALPDIGSAFKSLIHDCGNYEEPVFALCSLGRSKRNHYNSYLLLKEMNVFLHNLYSKL